MRAVGFLAGIGTLLWEARAAGMEVVGNIDTRPYYKSAPWIWPLNFDSPFHHVMENVKFGPEWFEAHLALGHPPCGSYSRLGNTGARKDKYRTAEEREARHVIRRARPGLVPLFIEMVNNFVPKMFALDNLPKLLETFPESWWEEQLPGYKLTFITMINWDYGSSQTRKRLWVVGSRGKRFRFNPPESRLDGPCNTWDAIKDLPWEPWINDVDLTHVHQEILAKPMGGFWVKGHEERTQLNVMTESALGFLGLPNGYLWPYATAEGRFTKKAGQNRVSMDRPSRVPTGNETLRHPLTGWPLTIRERARLMGWPDEFKFSDQNTDLTRSNILKLVKVTGRAVPSEFPRYLIPQLMKHARRI